jgi:hypothetical protein
MAEQEETVGATPFRCCVVMLSLGLATALPVVAVAQTAAAPTQVPAADARALNLRAYVELLRSDLGPYTVSTSST